MNAQEIQESMRLRLRKVGLTPTERGEREARRNQAQMKQELRAAIERLEPRDLFAVWMIANELTRADGPQKG